jgi:hypothetical protein
MSRSDAGSALATLDRASSIAQQTTAENARFMKLARTPDTKILKPFIDFAPIYQRLSELYMRLIVPTAR